LSVARMRTRREASVAQKDGDVSLVLLPAVEDDEESFLSPNGTERALSRQGARSPTMTSGGAGGGKHGTADFLVVLEIETRFGALNLPKFANAVRLLPLHRTRSIC
jgi:hypothetical protein